MQAQTGDRLRIKGTHVGDPDRKGRIVETRGADGAPPWVVRWDDADHDVLFFPGPDAEVVHAGSTS
jgi:hypothetical protein